jgi:hypothetical protein
MTTASPAAASGLLSPAPPDFSLVLGGPLYQLLRGARLTGDGLQLLRRRIIAAVLLTWPPLLLLSAADGHAWGDSVALSFVRDVELHARLLIALPLLIAAELVVHKRMRTVVAQFLDRGLVPREGRARFVAIIDSALRLRNSLAAEVLLMAFVYVVGVGFIWRTQGALDGTSWYGASSAGAWQPSRAGWWLGAVSLPVFQFLLLRWYFRLFIWARFLWQVSRLGLNFQPMHPDRCGGIGFLGGVSHAFAPVLVAQGVLLAGNFANQIFYAGAKLPDFKMEAIGLVAVMVFAVLGPLLVFAVPLADAKRRGLREYGTLAQRYAREFDDKWLRGGAPAEEPFVGSGDIQSLADLGNSFEVVKGMRFVPVTSQAVLQLAAATLAPVVPLALTMISVEELLGRVFKIVF